MRTQVLRKALEVPSFDCFKLTIMVFVVVATDHCHVQGMQDMVNALMDQLSWVEWLAAMSAINLQWWKSPKCSKCGSNFL